MTPWLLVDYGEVISLPYDPASLAEITRILGTEPEHYWTHRPPYDGGQASRDYWPLVAGRAVTDDELAALDEVDLRGWGRIDGEVVAYLHELRDRGVRLALLSNAPHNQAAAFDEAPWLEGFEHVFVSSRLGDVKPNPAVFERVLQTMGAEPADVTFVDDRPDNVAAAAALGIHAVLFTGLDDLRAELARPVT